MILVPAACGAANLLRRHPPLTRRIQLVREIRTDAILMFNDHLD